MQLINSKQWFILTRKTINYQREMTIDIRVPEAGESITQVELARWLVEDGSYVEKDQEIAEIDSDKATLTINAEAAGIIKITLEEGTTTEPGKIIGQINTKAIRPERNGTGIKGTKQGIGESNNREVTQKDAAQADETQQRESVISQGDVLPMENFSKQTEKNLLDESPGHSVHQKVTSGIIFSPQAKKTLEEHNLPASWDSMHPDSRRITKKDVLVAISGHFHKTTDAAKEPPVKKPESTSYRSGNREEQRQKMSTLRKKVAERLVAVKNQTAMLTTFNEADMTAILNLRKRYQQAFVEKYGFKLGFMSFFVKAVTESIPFFPQVNGYIDGQHIVFPEYADVGIAVSTPKGLMVPVIRNADSMTIPQLEESINILAEKARSNRITIDELTGGTISITNGGVFGSMLSTPIINPPQSAILGMHNIIERPVAVEGKVEIRPMMYLALSYDHRVIDGKESVSFLVKVKEMIENPVRMLFNGNEPEKTMLEL